MSSQSFPRFVVIPTPPQIHVTVLHGLPSTFTHTASFDSPTTQRDRQYHLQFIGEETGMLGDVELGFAFCMPH